METIEERVKRQKNNQKTIKDINKKIKKYESKKKITIVQTTI